MKEHFANLFNLDPKDLNSLEDNILLNKKSNEVRKQILEYTFDLPHKKLVKLSELNQQKRYLEVVSNSVKEIPHEEHVHYFEKCKDGVLHIHGKITLKGLFYIEGCIQSFVKNALKQIDGRLQYRSTDYYPNLYRYRSPLMCVQYTDDPVRVLHWDQYITKCV